MLISCVLEARSNYREITILYSRYFRGHNSCAGQQHAHNPGQRAGHQPRRDRRQRRIRIDRPRGSGFVLLLRFLLLSADQCLERGNSRESHGTFREAHCDCDDDKLMISLVSVILLRTKNLHSATGPLSLSLSHPHTRPISRVGGLNV